MQVWFSATFNFYLFLFSWLGHKDPKKCQRTRSMIHTSVRSESNLKYLVLLAMVIFSVDNLYVSTTLITLSKKHITSIFIFPYQSHVKLNIYAGLLCKNISESILCVLLFSYWWEIRAIYRQCFEMFWLQSVSTIWYWPLYILGLV